MYFPLHKLFPSNLNKKRALTFTIIGVLMGFLAFGLVRAASIKDDPVHFHANFALYIDDTRDTFDSFTFYEEVQSCNAGGHNDPKTRVHMHGQVNQVVHIHAEGVTWGHFFANLGYGLSDKSITTDDGTFVHGEKDKKLSFVLNGQPVGAVANKLISSEDTLLINYGNEKDVKTRFDQIKKDAGEYNVKPDPKTCSGSTQLDFSTRIKKGFDFTN